MVPLHFTTGQRDVQSLTHISGTAMGSFDFALERPRRIRICIEGYNPEVQRQAQLRRQQKRKRRLQHEAHAAARRPAPETALSPSFVDAARQLVRPRGGTLATSIAKSTPEPACSFHFLEMRVQASKTMPTSNHAKPCGRKNDGPVLRPMRTVHLGLAALGQLVARCSMDLQDGSVPADSVESLGFLMAELGDLAAECMRIAAECRVPGPEIGSTGADGTHE